MRAQPPIPRPRRLAREKGAAGVDRPPLRLYRTGPRFCPRGAVWVGPGSAWENPFADLTRTVVAAAKRIDLRRDEWGLIGGFERPNPLPEHRAAARAWLYREWRAGRLEALPQSVKFHLKKMAGELPAPPTDYEIRAALSGRDLVAATPDRWPSHVDELLLVANSRETRQ